MSQLARILEGKAEHSSPQHRQLPKNKDNDKKEETGGNGGASDVTEDFPYCHPAGNKYKLKKSGTGHAMHYETGQGVKDFKPGETIPMGEGYLGEGETLADDCSFVRDDGESDSEDEGEGDPDSDSEDEEDPGAPQEYCVEKGKNAKNGYHVKEYSGKPDVKTFPMEICTTKTPKCLKKEKNGEVEYVVKVLNYTPKKAVDMSFCEQDSEEDSTDEDEEDSEEDSGEDGDPYCIDAGDGTYTLEYYADPPAGALEPGDKVGDKVLSDLCDLEGGGEVTGDPHFVMWSGQKFDVRFLKGCPSLFPRYICVLTCVVCFGLIAF